MPNIVGQNPTAGSQIGATKQIEQPGEVATPTETTSAQQPSTQRASHDASAITQSKNGQELFKTKAIQTEPPEQHGVTNNVYKSLRVLREINGNPSKMVRALADMSSSSFSAIKLANSQQVSKELGQQIDGLDTKEQAAMAKKLGSRQMVALQRALKEGQATTKSSNQPAFTSLMRSMGDNLAQMQRQFGVTGGDDKPPTAKEMRNARKTCEKFAKEYDKNVTEISAKFSTEQVNKSEVRKFFPNVSTSALTGMAASKKIPHVCEQFVQDVCRQQTFLDRGSNGKQFLIPHGMPLKTEEDREQAVGVAAKRLLEFAGGDKEKCFLLSTLLNQRSAANLDMVDDFGGDLKIKGLPRITPGDTPHFPDGASANPIYTATQEDSGNISVKAQLISNPTGMFNPDDIETKEFYNPKASHINLGIEYTVENGNNTYVSGLDYDCRFVKEFVASAAEDFSSDKRDDYAFAIKQDVAAEAIGVTSDSASFSCDGNKANSVYSSKSETFALIEQAVADGALSTAQGKTLQDRYEFAEDMLHEGTKIANLEDADQLENALPRMADLESDVSVIFKDMWLKRDLWDGMGATGTEEQRNTALTAVGMKLNEVMGQLAEVSADTRSALDEARGDISEQVASNHFSRTNNASLQSRAGYHAIVNSLVRAQADGVELTDNHFALKDEALERANVADNCLRHVEDGYESPIIFSAGSKKEEAKKASDAMTTQLARGNDLPESHKSLSEAQLMELRISQFVKDNPEMKPYFKGYANEYKNMFLTELANANWAPIEKTIYDIGSDQKLRNYQSTIIPAPSLFEPATANIYQGAGVPCSQRLDGTRASNLAITSMTNEQGDTMFVGTRHGVFDAYLMTPEKLAKASDATVLKLLGLEHVQNDPGFQQQLPAELKDDLRGQMAWLRTPSEASERACTSMRQACNASAVRDSVQALVGADLLLRERALKDGAVDLTVDSLSLLTPDVFRTGASSERKMLEMQQNAWNTVAGNPGDARDQIPPVKVKLTLADGAERSIDVFVRKRAYNFAANAYGLGANKKAALLKPLMGFDLADVQNTAMLTNLIGDPNDPKIGGEAKNVVDYLHGEGSSGQLNATQLDALRSKEELLAEFPDAENLPEHAMSDPIDRAEAIQHLAVDIKQIYSSGAHRSSGVEPLKLTSRLALLSHLMGHQPYFNCKSGKDRTGQLDAEVKYLAANVYQGVFHKPDAKPDQIRKTNFVLKSGNLELQQYNTGLRGYKLKGNQALFNQLNSKEAIKTYKSDSSFVKS